MGSTVEKRISGIHLSPRGRATEFRPVVVFGYEVGAVDVTLDFEDDFGPIPVCRAQLYMGLRRLARNPTDDLRVEPVRGALRGVSVSLLHGTGEWLAFRFGARQVERFLEATVAADAPYVISEAEMCRSGRAS